MKMYALLFAFFFLGQPFAQANFQNLDQVVRQSVTSQLKSKGLQIDPGRFEYLAKPEVFGQTLIFSTAVVARNQADANSWSWYRCRTWINIVGTDRLQDDGSICSLGRAPEFSN
jgi:hypothetical protein